jgi:hypothetical protein
MGKNPTQKDKGLPPEGVRTREKPPKQKKHKKGGGKKGGGKKGQR